MNQEENINKSFEGVDIVPKLTYAGFWRRFVGWLIDLLILIIISHWIISIISKIIKIPIPLTLSFSEFFLSALLFVVTTFIVNFIVIALFFSFLESSPLQATIGKYIAGLKITTIEGSRVSFGKSFIRRIYSLLSIIPIWIGYIVAGFTAQKQTLHDMLAKTVVVVYKPRKKAVLVGIVILTIIAGILSDIFLGAGFRVSFNFPEFSFSTKSGFQTFIIQKEYEVDPFLKKAIIEAYLKRKILFASGDLPKIRQYLLEASSNDKVMIKKLTNMSDSDLQNTIEILNKIQTYITEDLLRDPNTIWIFNKNMDKVKIQVFFPSKNGVTKASIDMVYTNGQWY